MNRELNTEAKRKITRKLIEKADVENTNIYEKINNTLDLSHIDQEKLVEILSNNIGFINKWTDKNVK